MTEYLLLLSQGKSLKPLQGKFLELGGFYNGIGYVFPLQNEHFLKELVLPLHLKILKMPLGQGQSFESLRQSFKSVFFKEKLAEKQFHLLQYQKELALDEISEENIKSSDLPQHKKLEIAHLIDECERLKKSIEWAEGMEKATSLSKSRHIQFIHEQEINFLLDEAPSVPRLINYFENEQQKPLIRKGIVAMLVGAGGVGKTHALAQLAISIATGQHWFGKYPIENPGYVFMGLGENTEDDIHRLLRKIVINQFKNHADKNAFLLEASRRLATKSFVGTDASFIHQNTSTAAYETLLDELKIREPKEGWSCLIFDPISRFLGSDAETDNADATRFIALLEKMIAELKGHPTIFFGHHMNKGGVSSTHTDQSAARGSSAITDGVRQQFNLERAKKENEEEDSYDLNVVNFRMVKSNFTKMLPPQKLIKNDVGYLYAFEEAPIENRIILTSENLKKQKK